LIQEEEEEEANKEGEKERQGLVMLTDGSRMEDGASG